ncbi:hypothetical protein BYT27DRAFT_7221594 [Phlegmacium glaucopus]|nr:hypothetical protein BYT27DRAFT_7221594 [Phlegmacium glaucopus]
MALSSVHNRNPEGKNQYGPVLTVDSLLLRETLEKYHQGLITNNQRISELLLADHGINMKPRTVKKHWQQLGLTGSQKTMKMLDPTEAEQLVLDQMDHDPARHQGRTGHHLTRDFVMETMQIHDSAGFSKCDPTSKKIHREPKVPIRINERWSADGHDKLYGIGFPIWAIVDDATGRWLDIYVVPSNRMGHTILYLFLCTIEAAGGMPLQTTTDCGSETTQLHGMAKALCDSFHPDINSTETPAHVYVRSVHNIAVECSWLHFCLEFGDSVVICFKQGEGDGVYLSHIPEHAYLLHKLAKEFMESQNLYKSRLDHMKAGPSRMSCNKAYSLPHTWGGWQCLLEVDMDVIQELKSIISEEEDIFHFPLVTVEFEQVADTIYQSLHIQDPSLCNVWNIFSAMLPFLCP